jgi:2-polyprenyl-3-methyl-5-hydroxy-6-metoxy-1,4-benzoquinol methylase
MDIFNYGKLYSELSTKTIRRLSPSSSLNKGFSFLVKFYFRIFGYPDVASQRRYLIVEKLLCLKKGEKVLDAGCGNGIYLQEFGSKFNVNGFGVDAQKDRVENAKSINKDLRRNDVFLTSTLEKVNLGKNKFDKAICLEVLEHIKDDSEVVKKLARNLKPGGIFIISVPMKGTALSKKQENDPNFEPQRFEHVRSGYEIKDIKKMAQISNLKIISIEKYFFIVSRYMVRIQQFLYKKNFVVLNLIFSPLLLLISSFDNIFKIYPRGYIVELRKQ